MGRTWLRDGLVRCAAVARLRFPRVRGRPTWTYNLDARGGTSWHNIPIERPAGMHDATAIKACGMREMPAVSCTRSGLVVSAAAGSVQTRKPVCEEA